MGVTCFERRWMDGLDAAEALMLDESEVFWEKVDQEMVIGGRTPMVKSTLEARLLIAFYGCTLR